MRFFQLCILLLSILLMAGCKSSQPVVAETQIAETESDSLYQAILRERLRAVKSSTRPGTDRKEQGSGKEEKYSIVPIYYSTDRKPSGTTGPYNFYTDSKGNGDLHYGKCLVTVPKIHALGEIEKPGWWKLEFSENVEKHMTIREVRSLSQDKFFGGMKTENPGKKEAVVFIHGYNVSFDDAVLRSAQLVYDLSYDGVPILYSWPSQGSLLSYLVDGERSAWTIPHLELFLKQVADESGFEKIHVIAHSMGNRAFTAALSNIARDFPNKKFFDQVVLAAPDIDTDIFTRDLAPRIQSTANNITLYASSKDKALLLSKTLHDNPRIGEGGESLTVVPGIESIDASGIDTDFLGHSYFSTTWLLINDIYKLINKGLQADSRGLPSGVKNELKFWMLK